MKITLTLFASILSLALAAQTVLLEGYTYEKGNRGYLSMVTVSAQDANTGSKVGVTTSDADGFFSMEVPANSELELIVSKDMFNPMEKTVTVGSAKTFAKLELNRSPGYLFEVTLAERRDSDDIIVDAIKGARIEVYNNTTKESVMDLKNHDSPEFKLNLQKGNHYTVLVRKDGFLSKRMEAKVDVEGCILCFEGVGSVNPGVSDNLTEGNAFGVLLANVELERIFEGKKMEVQNLYYDLAKFDLRQDGRQELNKVITLMRDNPNLTLELGSHTDSRGNDESNQILSKKRAQSAVAYLIDKGDIAKARIVSRGYGEDILITNCPDGVKCTEEEHARNRRTELKIIGITDVAEIKSLKKMKEEEQLEKEILELMDQEEVIIDSEEDLQRLIAGEDIKESQQERVARELSELNEKKRLAKLKGPEIKEDNRVFVPAQRLENPEPMKILDKDLPLEVLHPDYGNTTGIKVVLFVRKMATLKTHAMYTRHEYVQVYKDENGLLYYMLDGYETVEDARAAITDDFKVMYPKAHVSQFVDNELVKVEF